MSASHYLRHIPTKVEQSRNLEKYYPLKDLLKYFFKVA